MSGEPIGADVKRFITETIDSVDQLEVLLFLMSNPAEAWSAEQIGGRVRLDTDRVQLNLARLEKARLLVAAGDEPTLYKYSPANDALAREVAEALERAYRERRDTLLELIYTRPLDNIRIFADAFRLRKKE